MVTERKPAGSPWYRAVLIASLVFPTLLTLAYFDWLEPPYQNPVYLIGKIIQFAFPMVWVALVLREKIAWQRPSGAGVLLGLAFGAVILVAALLLYHWVLKPVFTGPDEIVRLKIRERGIDTAWKYGAFGVFYAIAHSLLEEYYWRWFVFRKWAESLSGAGFQDKSVRVWPAMFLSSLGFMAHHVVLMKTFFGWASPWTYLFSLAVAIGGLVWAWLYHRSQSLCGPWWSHSLVDAAIFLVGFDIARPLF